MIAIYISYFVFFLAIIAFIFIIGFFVACIFQRKIIKVDSFYVFAWIFIIGLLGLIFFTSVLQTKGKTSYILILPSLIFFHKLKPLEVTLPNKNFQFSHLVIILFGGILSFSISFIALWDFSLGDFHTISDDNVFYAQLAKVLIHSSQENTYSTYNFLLTDLEGVSPYHYADIWLANFLIRFSSLPPGHIISIIVYPTFLFGWFLVLFSFMEHFQIKNKLIWIMLGIVSVMMSGIWIDVYSNINFLRMITVFHSYPLSVLGEKATVIYILLGIGLLELYKNNGHVALFLVSVVGIIYPLFVPAGILIFVINLGYGWYKQHVFQLKQALIGLFIYALYLGFYWLFDSRKGQCLDLNFNFAEEILELTNPAYGKIALNVFLGGWIQLFASYFLFLPLIYLGLRFGFKGIIKKGGIIILSSLLAGLSVWAVLFNIIDMVQLVTGAGVVLMNVFISFLVIGVFSSIPTWYHKLLLLTALGLVIVLQINSKNFKYFQSSSKYYAESYKQKVESIPMLDPKTIIAIQRSDFGGILDLLSSHRILASFILSQKKNTFQVSLDDFDVPSFKPAFYHEKVAETIRKTGIFYQFYQTKKEIYPLITVSQARLLFLDENKINIFICDKKTVLPEGFDLKFNLVATDSNSGERCYVRKN